MCYIHGPARHSDQYQIRASVSHYPEHPWKSSIRRRRPAVLRGKLLLSLTDICHRIPGQKMMTHGRQITNHSRYRGSEKHRPRKGIILREFPENQQDRLSISPEPPGAVLPRPEIDPFQPSFFPRPPGRPFSAHPWAKHPAVSIFRLQRPLPT